MTERERSNQITKEKEKERKREKKGRKQERKQAIEKKEQGCKIKEEIREIMTNIASERGAQRTDGTTTRS